MTDTRDKFVAETFEQTLARVPELVRFKGLRRLTNRTLPEFMALADTMPGYELLSVQGGLDGSWSVFRRVRQLPHMGYVHNAHASDEARGAILMRGHVVHPQRMGHYKDEAPVRYGDVVRLNSGGPDMTVIGCTKSNPPRLFCEWAVDSSIPDQSDIFDLATLTLISPAPEPAVPATQEAPAPSVDMTGGLGESGFFPVPELTNEAAPNVTPADVEAAIASEHYYTGQIAAETPDQHRALGCVMHCTLVMKNGRMVTGEAYLQDPAKPDPERAQAAARRRAFDKAYDLVVYAASPQPAENGKAAP